MYEETPPSRCEGWLAAIPSALHRSEQGAGMNSVKLVAAIGAAVVALGVAAISANGSASTSATALTLTGAPRGGSMIDLAKKGPSVGDEILENGVIKGSDEGTYNVIGQLIGGNIRRGTEHTVLALRLAHGEIEAAGAHGLVDSFTLAIVGGTGDYAGARGSVALSPQSGRTEKLVLKLN